MYRSALEPITAIDVPIETGPARSEAKARFLDYLYARHDRYDTDTDTIRRRRYVAPTSSDTFRVLFGARDSFRGDRGEAKKSQRFPRDHETFRNVAAKYDLT